MVTPCNLPARPSEGVARIVSGERGEYGLEGVGAVSGVLVREGPPAGVAPEALGGLTPQAEGAVADDALRIAVRAGRRATVGRIH